jgi:hypothetical protein
MPKKKITAPRKIRAVFGLRDEETGLFWDGVYPREKTRRTYYGVRRWRPHWTPKFSDAPARHWLEPTALKLWKQYEIERLCGEKIPALGLVRFEMIPLEVKIEPEITFSELTYQRLKRSSDHGNMYAEAFDKLSNTVGNDVDKIKEYRFVFSRKLVSAGKAILEEQMPDAVSYRTISFVKSENDVLFAKLLLGEHFAGHVQINKFYQPVEL